MRRWADTGRLRHATSRAAAVVDGATWPGSPRSGRSRPSPAPTPVVAESARNRFVGMVTRVVRDTVMAQVEIQAGPFRVVSLMSREAADELGSSPACSPSPR